MSRMNTKLIGLLLVLCVLLCGMSALAENTGSITVNMPVPERSELAKAQDKIESVKFTIYRVAQPNGATASAWEPTADFAGLDLTPSESGDWTAEQAEAMGKFAQDKVKANPSIENAGNHVFEYGGSFTFSNLLPGIYVGIPDEETKSPRLRVNPFVVAVPSFDKESGKAVYDVEVKMDSKIKYTDPEPVEVSVEKKWDDGTDFDGIQPESVTVQLVRSVKDGKAEEVGEAVDLNVENSWTYAWPSLPDAESGWDGLPDSDINMSDYTYTVTEVPVDGYTTEIESTEKDGKFTVVVENTHVVNYGALQIEKAMEVQATDNISREALAKLKATLNNEKFTFLVTGPKEYEGGKLNDYEMTVTVTVNDDDGTITGTSAVVQGLMPGTYTVTEVLTDEQKAKGITCAAESKEVEVKKAYTSKNKPATITPDVADFTNNLNLGSLKVEKTVTMNGKAWDQLTDAQKAVLKGRKFTFTVTGPNKYEETITATIKDDGTLTYAPEKLENLLAGEYTVTENVEALKPDNVVASDSGVIKVNIEAGTIADVKTAAITNDYQTGDLEVSKTVVSDKAADATVEFEFTVTLKDTPINGKYGEMTFDNGVATFKLKNGESVKAEGLPVGAEYEVAEAAVTGFTTESEGAKGTIAKDAVQTAAFTNTREKGDLTVTKSVESYTSGDKDIEFTFTVTLGDEIADGTYGDMTFTEGKATFTLKDGESKTATGLPTSVKYEVTEETIDGFEVKYDGKTGTISTTAATASVTNTRQEGALEVSKKVVSEKTADQSVEFEFTVTLKDTSVNGSYGDMNFTNGVATFKLRDGESRSAARLPVAVEYTVTEKELAGFTNTEKSGESGKIKEGTSYARFTNERNTAPLTVKKTLKSDRAADKNQKFEFTVELGDKTISGKYGDMTFVNGVYKFTLAGGESKTATGLPTSLSYVVEEKQVEGFKAPVYKNENSTIPAEGAEVEVTNTRETGDLEVTKTVKSDLAADKDVEFTFTVTLSDKTISGKYGDMTFDKGVATVTLKGGEKAIAEGLPTDVTYEVTEAKAEGFTTASTGANGTIATTKSTAAFTNTRETGSLTVTKTVVSPSGADKQKEFTFSVTLSDKTISGKYGDMTFDGGVATVKLKDGESATATDLPTTVTYTVEEAEDKAFTTTQSGDSGEITTAPATAAFTNTKTQGNLTVTKTVISDVPADLDKPFEFTVTLSDTTVNGTFGEEANAMTFENGVSTFSLKNGESAYAEGLPDGVTYTVEETAYGEFTTTKTGDTGTIEKDKPATAAFTNTHKTGDLEISKTVKSDLAADKDVKFTFTVTLSDTGITKTYGDMSFENGIATVTLKGGESAKATGLPTTLTYEVTEAEAKGFTTAKTGDTGTITEGEEPAKAEFTNTRQTGDLEISKTVVSDKAADKTQEFTFTVELEDKSITGTYGGMTFEGGKATVTLKGGEKATATGLPTTVGYTVTEASATGFDTEATGDKGEISTTKSEAKFTNTRQKGDLEVSKTVVSDKAADANETFTFTVTLGDTSISGTYGDMTFTDGVATVTLKDGGKAIATGLPTTVTYTVTEAEAKGFTTDKTGDTGTISTTKSEAKFTNTRETGDLEVSKTVESDLAADKDQEFTFTVSLDDKTISGKYGDMTFDKGVATVTLKDGEKATATGLPTTVGYTVTEKEDASNFTTDKTGDSGEISTELSKAEFTNTRKTGDLTVSKTVVSKSGADHSKPFNFTVELSDKTISGTFGDMEFSGGSAKLSLTDGETKTATGLPITVTYTVEEAEDEAFITTKSGDSGEIKTEASTAAFTNTRPNGDLTVNKTVVSTVPSDSEKDFAFTVRLSDATVNGTFGDMTFVNGLAEFKLKNGGSASAKDLPDGVTYTVEEEPDADFITEYSNGTNTGKISKDAPAVVTVTNSRRTGKLEISKTVKSDLAADKNVEFEFTIELGDREINSTFDGVIFVNGIATVKVKDGETKSISGLPIGIGYKVTETVADGFTTEYTGETGTIEENKTAAAAFTNTREVGDLEVSKTVESDLSTDHTQQSFTFTVTLKDTTINGLYGDMAFTDGVATVTLKDGEKATATGLPTTLGYTVTETVDEGFKVTKTGTTGKIKKDETATAAFTNTRKLGDLEVSKKVVSKLAADADQTFTFTVVLADEKIHGTYGEMYFDKGVATVTLKGGERAIAKGLPDTLAYTVTEAADDNFTTTSEGASGNIVKDETQKAAFTNTRKTGDLVVTKKVTSHNNADKTKDFKFTVTLGDEIADGTYGDMTFTEGKATFTLKDGESKTATGLPTTVKYTVEEAEDKAFVTTKTGDTGAISGTPSAAVFTNTKTEGGLTVTKKVVSDLSADKQKDFTFTVTLDDTSINGTFGDMTFTNGVATFTLKDGEPKTADGLPENVGYTVTEAAEKDFTTTYDGATGKVEKDKTSPVSATNTRKTGGLEISKTLVSDLAADKDVKFTFTVELDNKEISKTYGEMTFEKGVATVELKGGEKATAEGLPVGIGYIVTEADVDGIQNTAKTGDTGDIAADTIAKAEFTNTRDVGDLEISKIVESATKADESKEFTFRIVLGDTSINKTFDGVVFNNGKAEVNLKHGDTIKITGLPTTLTYTVTEETENGFKPVYEGTTGAISTEPVAAKVTNPRQQGDLEISKTVDSDAEADHTKEFKFTVTIKDGNGKIADIVDGEYGDMTFEKGVASVTLKDGDTKKAVDLPAPFNYTVEEEAVTNFETKSTGERGSITDGATATAEFTNTREKGDLEVTKIVDDEVNAALTSVIAADRAMEFNFTVTLSDTTINGTYGDMEFKDGVATFTLKHGETKTAKDLPREITYTVTEADATGFTVTKTGDTGAIAEAKATAEFHNNRPVGDLVLTKSVRVNGGTTTGTQADGTYYFTITAPTGEKLSTSIEIKNGADNTAKLANLLPGEYTISEDLTKMPTNVRIFRPLNNSLKFEVKAGVTADTENIEWPEIVNNYTTPGGGNPPPDDGNPPTTTVNGQKVWNDENNTHNTRPNSITVELLRNGVRINTATVTGTGNTWYYSFRNLPVKDEYGNDYEYTVNEVEVEGYTTTVNGTVITNDLIPRQTENFTNFNGVKTWDDDNNDGGARPNYITVRLLRDGVEVEQRTVTAANGWQYSFNNMPVDDGYGNNYTYTIREDAVPGYFTQIDGFNVTNTRLIEVDDYATPLAGMNEEGLEDLVDLFDYGTPLWGNLLKTGDETPIYPFVFGGVGITALGALMVMMIIGKKKKEQEG